MLARLAERGNKPVNYKSEEAQNGLCLVVII